MSVVRCLGLELLNWVGECRSEKVSHLTGGIFTYNREKTGSRRWEVKKSGGRKLGKLGELAKHIPYVANRSRPNLATCYLTLIRHLQLIMSDGFFAHQVLDEVVPALFGEIVAGRPAKTVVTARPDEEVKVFSGFDEVFR